MSRPIKLKSVDAQTATGAGSASDSKGHPTISLYVVARNFDSVNDDLAVRVETAATQDGEYAPINNLDVVKADFVDVDGDGTYAAFVRLGPTAAQYLRANVTTYTDAAGGDLSVDAYVLATGWSGGGYDFREVT